VDGIVGPEEVVVRPLPPLFRRHRLFAGVTLSGAGEIVYVFDGWELIALGLGRTGRPAPPAQPGTPDGSVEEPSVSPTRVLVVDDSLSVRRSVNKLLTQRGFAVTEASNGLEALELLHTQSFSLIFTDVEMPRLGGLELLGELKRGRHARPQRVIVMSSCSDHETRARADQLGADAYLIKPATDAALGHLLSQLGLATR
jgi:chemosensory pili system protein ChpA (sensor histidine kinase/response regulator)